MVPEYTEEEKRPADSYEGDDDNLAIDEAEEDRRREISNALFDDDPFADDGDLDYEAEPSF